MFTVSKMWFLVLQYLLCKPQVDGTPEHFFKLHWNDIMFSLCVWSSDSRFCKAHNQFQNFYVEYI